MGPPAGASRPATGSISRCSPRAWPLIRTSRPALAISFIPDPLKAVKEMMRVVRPGGWVATYMWDLPGGGIPIEPMYRALKSLDIAVSLPGIEISRRENMRAVWEKAGLQVIDTRVIRIPVVYSDFEDFWQSFNVPERAKWSGDPRNVARRRSCASP